MPLDAMDVYRARAEQRDAIDMNVAEMLPYLPKALPNNRESVAAWLEYLGRWTPCVIGECVDPLMRARRVPR